jgi:hypothetical protein
VLRLQVEELLHHRGQLPVILCHLFSVFAAKLAIFHDYRDYFRQKLAKHWHYLYFCTNKT